MIDFADLPIAVLAKRRLLPAGRQAELTEKLARNPLAHFRQSALAEPAGAGRRRSLLTGALVIETAAASPNSLGGHP